MKIKFSAIVMVAMLVSIILASCAKSELEPNDENGRITLAAAVGTSSVEANSTYSNAAQSKAPALAIDELELSFARADESSSGTYPPYAATALTATRAAGTGEQALVFNPVQYYRADGLKTKLTGWYPQGTYNSTTSTVSWTIDGQQDIMTAPKQEGSWTIPMPSVTFNHRLTQLRFHPYAEEQSTINSWGKITRIEVLNQQNEVSYTLVNDATGAVSFSGAATNLFSAGIAEAGVNMSLSTAADKATNAVQMGKSVMIAPQSAVDHTLSLRIYTDKNLMKTITLAGALEAGVPYRLYLRFKTLDITIEAVVAQWDDVAASDNIGSGPSPINPPAASDYVTIGALKWTKGNLVAVDETNCKVGAATDVGVYFKFGSLVGWSGGATGDGLGTGSPALAVQVKPVGYAGSTAWSDAGYYKDGTADDKDYNLPTTDAPTTGIGDPCRLYLGTPWRTPTAAEWLTLLGTDGANTNKVVPLKLTSHELYFPSSGYRHSYNGASTDVGSTCHYWSSSVENANGYTMNFYAGSVKPQSRTYRSLGMPVRCVSE